MRTNSLARVMVVEDVELEAKLLMRTLADAGYSNIGHARDLDEALAELEKSKPRIVVTDLELGNGRGLELVKRIRSQTNDEYVFIVMLTSHTNDTHVRSSFEAGVDDFVNKPYRPEELLGRLRAGERILALETMLRARSRELETALRRIDVAAAQRALAKAAEVRFAGPASGATALDALLGTEAWGSIEKLLSKSMSDFFQLPFDTVPVTAGHVDAFVAEVSLSDPAKQLEMGLSVVTEGASMAAFAMHLLGADDDLEGSQALVLEVANILMGALKTAFTNHGFSFTGGIPSALPFDVCRTAFDSCKTRTRLAVGSGESKAELWIRLKEKTNTKVRGSALREGLVIGEDLRDARGMLLIKGGSRLTQTAAERLSKLVPDMEVTVTDPAAA